MAKKLANDHGKGALPLSNKAGNVQSTFNTGKSLDASPGGNSRRASGGNRANAGEGKKRGSSISELRNVDGRSSKKDGQRYGGSPALSGKTKGPAGIRSKKGRLK